MEQRWKNILIQHIDKPANIRGESMTCIDLIIKNNDDEVSLWNIEYTHQLMNIGNTANHASMRLEPPYNQLIRHLQFKISTFIKWLKPL